MSSFHYDFILSKRSTLAKVWLAAHWEKKLSKNQIFETNLQLIVHDILHPKMPIALRTSSHLLVGLVRIYSRKAKYLLKDCSDTVVNIKVAFRPGVSSLDKPVKRKKSVKEVLDDCPLFITEKIDLFDQWISEISVVELDCSLNQSKVEEITLQEEPMKVNTIEDYFDDEGFGEMDVDVLTVVTEKTSCSSVMERMCSFADSAYGTDEGTMAFETFSLTDYSDPFSSLSTPIKDPISSPAKETPEKAKLPKLLLDLGEEFHNEEHQTETPCLTPPFEDKNETTVADDTFVLEENSHCTRLFEDKTQTVETNQLGIELGKEDITLKQSFQCHAEEVSEEVLVLTPIENASKKTDSSRKSLKRKLLIDEVISIERAVIFDNLSNASQLLKPPEIAPSTKCQMRQTTRDKALLTTDSFVENLSPCIEKLFFARKSRKFLISTNVSDDTVIVNKSGEKERHFSFVSSDGGDFDADSCKADEFDFSPQFIPLQDHECSSDEESPRNEQQFDVLDLTKETSTDENEPEKVDFTQEPLEIEEEADAEHKIIDENISEDKFCSFVESTVLESQPEAVQFQEIVGGDGNNLNRKTVARRFLKCLLMQRDARLSLEQKESFKTILLHPGVKHISKEAVR